MTTVEQRRQTLLREMGIPCWFPRTRLPGARGSHSYPLPESASREDAPVADPEPLQQVPAGLAATLSQLKPETVARAAPEPEPASAALPEDPEPLVAATAAVDDEAAPDFAFSWFNVSKQLAVVAMLPPGADRLTSSCRVMLQRILGALSSDLKNVALQEHTFHWPFPEDLGLPSGKIAARHAVDGFVARRLREQSATTLLVLADERPPFLYHKIEDANAGGANMPEHPQFCFAMLHTHSLHAMEANAELKRSAWQAMKLIVERLDGSPD